MSDPTETDLARRVRRLEIIVRVLLASGVGLAAVTLYYAATASPPSSAAPPVADLLQARRLQVVDVDGRVRIDLRHDDAETGLFLLDEVGDTRLGAAQFSHGGGGFALHGPGDNGAAVLYLSGAGSLTFYGEGGEILARYPDASGGGR
jgi:hypothetical protein